MNLTTENSIHFQSDDMFTAILDDDVDEKWMILTVESSVRPVDRVN